MFQIYGGAKYTIRDFNSRNDRLSTVPANPVVAGDGTAVEHTVNTDGSVDISFKWTFSGSGDAYNIDGFLVYIRSSTFSGAYVIGTTPSEEQVHPLPSTARAHILRGQPANLYYTFGVQSHRIVDPDVNASEILKSGIVQPSLAAEDPYRCSATVAFSGDITGTIGGVPYDEVSKTPATFVVGDTDTSTNVKRADYVIPTGATNAQVKIQEAIDDFGAGGGEVVLLDGTYDMTDHVTVPANVTVRGQGNSTILKSAGAMPGSAKALIEILDYGPTVRDLHIQGVGAGTDTWRGIYAEGTSGTPLQNLKVMNVGFNDLGLPPIYANHISNSEITGCVVRDCAATTMIYVPVNVRIHGNSFDSITTEFMGGLLVSGDGSDRGRNVTITGNTARNCNSAGIYVVDLDGGVVANNAVSGSRYCDPFGGWGICVDADNIQVSGNDCSQNEEEGILVAWGSSGINMTGNTCVANGQKADNTYSNIHLNSCSGCNVQGNTVRIGTYALHSGTAQAGGASTITLATTASAVDDAYNSRRIWITSGTGSGQNRLISDYVGATKVATVDSAWGTQSNNTSVYEIKGRAKYGLHLGSSCTNTVATNNDLLTGGATASLQDDGTGNVTAAGNRL
jgi:parallel beta-helix repeat protein